jgi:hypothetical protein
MSNSIAYTKNYTSILDAVYQRASVSRCLNSGPRMVRAGHNVELFDNKLDGVYVSASTE